jgi:hypothetical protein
MLQLIEQKDINTRARERISPQGRKEETLGRKELLIKLLCSFWILEIRQLSTQSFPMGTGFHQ